MGVITESQLRVLCATLVLLLLVFLTLRIRKCVRAPMRMSFRVIFPGIPVKRTAKGEDITDDVPPCASAMELSPDTCHLRFAVEGVDPEILGQAKWRLHLYFTIYNGSHHEVTVYDMHAHVYCSKAAFLGYAAIGYREWIEIYDTNSILAAGKVYSIEPGKGFPVELTFEITRLAGTSSNAKPTEGIVLSIFGIFIDYRIFEHGRIVQMRIPMDCVFVFQALGKPGEKGHLIYVNNDNISDYWEKHKSDRTMLELVGAFQEALQKHCSQVFVLQS